MFCSILARSTCSPPPLPPFISLFRRLFTATASLQRWVMALIIQLWLFESKCHASGQECFKNLNYFVARHQAVFLEVACISVPHSFPTVPGSVRVTESFQVLWSPGNSPQTKQKVNIWKGFIVFRCLASFNQISVVNGSISYLHPVKIWYK